MPFGLTLNEACAVEGRTYVTVSSRKSPVIISTLRSVVSPFRGGVTCQSQDNGIRMINSKSHDACQVITLKLSRAEKIYVYFVHSAGPRNDSAFFTVVDDEHRSS